MKYTVESDHAEVLSDGRLALVDAEIELSNKEADDEFNARLIDEGRLVPTGQSRTSTNEPPALVEQTGDQNNPEGGPQ